MDKHRIRLEYSILGKLMYFSYEFENALNLGLKANWFTQDNLKKIFDQMLQQYEKTGKIEISILEISDELFDTLESYGESVVFLENVVNELKKINKKDYLNNKIKDILGNNAKETEEKIQDIQVLFEKIEENENDKLNIFNPGEMLNDYFERLENGKINGILNPFKASGNFFNLLSGQLIVIGARPSMGKSAMGLAYASKVAENNNALFVSLEMPMHEVNDRILASLSDVSLEHLLSKRMSDFEKKSLSFGIGKYGKLKLKVFIPEGKLIFEDVVRDIEKIHKEINFKLIVIDYLTLMRSRNKEFSNRNLEVEYMANELKRLAKKWETCIMTLAQLNRGKETQGTKPKKPSVSDLRDSGGIEQAADIIGLLYREDYYEEKDREEKDYVLLEMIIGKNRQGKTGVANFGYQKSTQKISGG